MRTLIISDIHGYHDEFVELLKLTEYHKNKDKLVLLGDYVDKGKQSREVIKYIMRLSKNSNVHIIGGNHDELFLKWIDNNDRKLMPYNGDRVKGYRTIKSFCKFYRRYENENKVREWIKSKFPEEIRFLRKLQNYYEDKHYIYVHAGINPRLENWRDTSDKDFRWIREKFFKAPHQQSKTVIFGHTDCTKLHNDRYNSSIWFGDKKIGIDGGGSKAHPQLNALEIINGQYNNYFVPLN